MTTDSRTAEQLYEEREKRHADAIAMKMSKLVEGKDW